MDTKSRLIERLENKLQAQQRIYQDAYLLKKGIQFEKDKLNYNNSQRFVEAIDIPESDIPLQTKILRKALRNIKQSNPTTVPNANDNNQFPAYQFLKNLQEPASKYFPGENDTFIVVEYLAMKYDESFPSEKNGFDEIVYYEGADIYRSVKRDSISDLISAFVCRGLPKPDYGHKHDYESVSKAMTESRYRYLTHLAASFKKDPQSSDIIGFVKELPDNTWFDSTIRLYSDDDKEFDALNEKYIPNYNAIQIENRKFP